MAHGESGKKIAKFVIFEKLRKHHSVPAFPGILTVLIFDNKNYDSFKNGCPLVKQILQLPLFKTFFN